MISSDCFIKKAAFEFIKIIYLSHGKAINYGIKTGYNAAFIIDKDTKEALIAEDPRSADIIKPVLRGRDIKRYRAEWAGLWLIATFPALALNIDDYPAVKKHLLSFGKARLEQSGRTLPNGTKSRKKTVHTWYELQDTCAYHADFAEKKVVWAELSRSGNAFDYEEGSMYLLNSSYFMTGESLHYILAILNSRIMLYYLNLINQKLDRDGFRWLHKYVECLPIPKISISDQYPFVNLVKHILAAKNIDPNADISAAEAEINLRAYNLYGLTRTEITAVEA